MKTIQAKVNPRLLTKANRLFTGTLQGRIIEILQNARRAGATQVNIINLPDGAVLVRDNGQGIDDFEKLLELGGSGWEEALEQSEDPAGVGLFCLAPRAVTIRSKGRKVAIADSGWAGEPVEIEDDPEPIEGTELCFQDETWTSGAVDKNAVFCGMQVTVDGNVCPRDEFVSDQATDHRELGCRIEIREYQDLNPWHHSCHAGHSGDNVLVNFHGQVVSFHHCPAGEHHLHYLVDMTGESTGIRLMLPARTCLVQNEAYKALLAAMELETFRYLQRRGHHRLAYKEYLRARELGIDLPEATPTFRVGLLSGEPPEPIDVTMPDGFPLSGCYRLDSDSEQGDESDEANVHLLAALGTFQEPFIPVEIRREYDGYSWAKLPTVGKVEFKARKKLQESWLWSGQIVCVERIEIAAHTSDGRTFTSPVCMGIPSVGNAEENRFRDDIVYVTPEAQHTLSPSHIWYHLGGWNDDGDTYDTQESEFEQELDHFWALLVGPDEQFRRNLVGAIEGLKKNWKSITLSPNGTVRIQFKQGAPKTIRPPAR
ncbi:MAG: hypothetical protein KA354_24160 [Phycisphaerae bacterium]|nr:hypothetical protein [Phycisphaerae bacterium]